MAEILQGTTPSLEIKIDTSDFLVSDVVKLELAMLHNGTLTTYGLNDVTVDAEENSFIYTFTEEETLALTPNKPLFYQLRFMFTNGSIVGTKRLQLQVADLYSEEVMTE